MVFVDVFSHEATVPNGSGSPLYWGLTITLKDTPHSVGLLWMSDQPVAETCTWQHKTLTTDIHALSGIRTHNPRRWAVADLRFRRRCHWDQPSTSTNRYQTFGRKRRLHLHFKGSLTHWMWRQQVPSSVGIYLPKNTTLHPKILRSNVI